MYTVYIYIYIWLWPTLAISDFYNTRAILVHGKERKQSMQAVKNHLQQYFRKKVHFGTGDHRAAMGGVSAHNG